MGSLGTFACPICGKDSPHTHSAEEVERHREAEAWVEESLQKFKRDYPHIWPNNQERSK
jgi:uncharacterized Zn finger protein (UPF0148 family)